MSLPPDPRTEIFRSSWSLYDAILGKNYMSHREIQAVARNVIAHRADRGPYSLVDLGCGNARGLSKSLRKFPPAHYLGVDASRPALEDAARELASLRHVEFREQDMLQCALTLPAASVDIVYSGFAMHHLSVPDKARLFRAIAAALSSDGAYLLVDIVREENESREQYLEGYIRMVTTEWTALTPAQKEEVRQHVTTFDYPETLPALAEMAQAAGLFNCRLLGRFRQHHVMLFSRLP